MSMGLHVTVTEYDVSRQSAPSAGLKRLVRRAHTCTPPARLHVLLLAVTSNI
jgi:hypothetical protein